MGQKLVNVVSLTHGTVLLLICTTIILRYHYLNVSNKIKPVSKMITVNPKMLTYEVELIRKNSR